MQLVAEIEHLREGGGGGSEHELGDVMVSTVADAANRRKDHRTKGLPGDHDLDRSAAHCREPAFSEELKWRRSSESAAFRSRIRGSSGGDGGDGQGLGS
jgi:hypothetical protein